MPRKQKKDHLIDDLEPSAHNLTQSLEQGALISQLGIIQPGRDELLDSRRMHHTTIMPSFEHGEKYHDAGKRERRNSTSVPTTPYY